jgi:hypothetical protein
MGVRRVLGDICDALAIIGPAARRLSACCAVVLRWGVANSAAPDAIREEEAAKAEVQETVEAGSAHKAHHEEEANPLECDAVLRRQEEEKHCECGEDDADKVGKLLWRACAEDRLRARKALANADEALHECEGSQMLTPTDAADGASYADDTLGMQGARSSDQQSVLARVSQGATLAARWLRQVRKGKRVVSHR